MPGVTIVQDTVASQLYAQRTSRRTKFVDELEHWVDPANQALQVGSVSLVARKKFGLNRAQVGRCGRGFQGLFCQGTASPPS